MSERTAATLTERQQYWLEQIRACEASGKTIAAYAAAHELSAQAMYAGKQMLVRKGILQMDETTVQILQEPGKTTSSESYLWIQRSGPPTQPVVLYDYAPGRGAGVPKRLLDGFTGSDLTTPCHR